MKHDPRSGQAAANSGSRCTSASASWRLRYSCPAHQVGRQSVHCPRVQRADMANAGAGSGGIRKADGDGTSTRRVAVRAARTARADRDTTAARRRRPPVPPRRRRTFRRPARPQGVAMPRQHCGIDCGRDLGQPVRPDGGHAARHQHALHCAPGHLAIEPVHRLRDGDEVHRAVSQRVVLLGGDGVGHSREARRSRPAAHRRHSR